jgi:hypothetical protein
VWLTERVLQHRYPSSGLRLIEAYNASATSSGQEIVVGGEYELYVSLGPVDDTLTRETRRVRVGVTPSDPKIREHISPCSP